MPRRRTLTLRGTGALLSGLGCLIAANMLGAPILLYIGILLLVLTVFSVLVVRLPRRTGTVTRQVSTDLLTVSETSRVTLRFTLRALRVPRGLWRDVLPPAVSGDSAGEYPSETGQLTYLITGVRRGVWPIGPLVVRTVDPFGLAQREQAFGETRTVTVVPEVFTLAPLTVKVGAAGGTAHTSSSRLGQGSDNLSPRRYIPGDSMRRIHWRATAHRGQLMVRQEEEESSPDALVILDRSAARWARPGDAEDPAFETAVSMCASVAVHLVQEGYGVDVIDSGGTLLGTLRGHEDDRDGLLVALALVGPRGEPRDLPTLVGGTPPGPLVYITGEIDDEDAALLRPSGAAAPMLFATAPGAGVVAAAERNGWRFARLGDDIAEAWEDVLPDRIGGTADHRGATDVPS
ncbi:hypothetical protein SRABI98_00326 [Microbacterium sp. Bi98]|uniref:DUF58 domain-containing protein n=1 Tax=unclassified Microbacterium TaxID=2609290 RepID=UPI0006FF7FCA|nr:MULTISPECIES: DUF58 domain-containing protein [unclassified Microbacterium]KRD50805.1 hypothetical protein ASE34_14920 [Microbacterium sp. Root280D1]CAH0132463.1 hypothetical protein SRABI98_00326 [Microbacterium sp. Bi98]